LTSCAHAIVNGRLVVGDDVLTGTTLIIRDGAIERLTESPKDESADVVTDVAGGYVLPGFIDLHVHGAFGKSFNSATCDAWLDALSAHTAAGTTTALATLATAPLGELRAALSLGAGLVEAGTPGLAGIHLEGPYLNRAQRGAHPADALRVPADGSWKQLLKDASALRMLTLAPELEGAFDLIRAFQGSGVVLSAGHSEAGPEVLDAARRDGLTHCAHLWSGQSSLHRRGPWRELGLLEAALSSDHLTAELIADGVHVLPEMARIAHRCLGPDRLCLVSDACAGAGLRAGTRFQMGSVEGIVDQRVALSADGTAFCGSTCFLSDIVRYCVREVGLSIGDCARMASSTPARVLGWGASLGRLAPRCVADLVVLDDDLRVKRVMQKGSWIEREEATQPS
jgi:N-acetylglucosamine-6-phosphate deacetylase